MNRRETGRMGERAAEFYYRLKGYQIVERNFRTRQGEIDLIVRRGETLVFAEVKTRGKNSIASPAEFVDEHKQRRIILAAKAYLARLGKEPFVRFDVIEVSAAALPFRVRCIENAFDA